MREWLLASKKGISDPASKEELGGRLGVMEARVNGDLREVNVHLNDVAAHATAGAGDGARGSS